MPGPSSNCSRAEPALTVIIPTLNEASALPALLADLADQREIALRVFVADGGSTDDTRLQASAVGAEFIEAPRGRAAQMNAGRQQAGEGPLLFLHADSRLPDSRLLSTAVAALTGAWTEAGHRRIAGHFALRFYARPACSETVFAYLEAKSRSGRPYTINGDQGLLIDSGFFDRLGGFDNRLPYLEDQRIAAAIRQRGQWLRLPGELHTSARRFETEGLMPRLQLMALIMIAHSAGLERFFDDAPALYRSQDQTDRLQVGPFLELFGQTLARLPKDVRREAWRRIGHFVRENAWQVALLRDARARRLDAPRALPRFERWIEPALASGRFDTLAAHAACMAIIRLWPRLARRQAA